MVRSANTPAAINSTALPGGLALFLGAMIITLSPIMVRFADVGPVTSAFWRLAFAIPILLVWSLWTLSTSSRRLREMVPDRGGLSSLAFAGLFFALDLAFVHFAIGYTTVGKVIFLNSLAPIMAILLMWVLFGQRPGPLVLIAAIVALLGSGLMALSGSTAPGSGASSANAFALPSGIDPTVWGDGAAFLSGVFYAGYLVIIGRSQGRLRTPDVMLWSSVFAAIVLLPLALVEAGPFFPVSTLGWALMIGLGVFIHAGGQGLIAIGLARGIGKTTLVLLAQPVLTVLAGWVFLSEGMRLLEIAGAALILLAVGAVQMKRSA